MKDLDFDELDKAVNSLMTANGKKPEDTSEGLPQPDTLADVAPAPAPEAAPEATPSTADTPEAAPAPTEEQEAKVDAAPATDTLATPATKPTPAVKRRGQFMDVVHPSSDMRAANKPTAPGRVGVTIAPPAPEPVEQASVMPPQEVPVAPIETSSSTDMPDPIDMHESRMASGIESPAPESEPTEDTPPIPEPAAPVESPFLSDAQVEKRPLGAAAPTGGMPSTISEATPDVAPEAPVVAATKEQVAEIAPPKPEEVSTEAAKTPDEPIVSKVEPIKESTPPSAISQQYKEQESTGDKDHAGLYDAAAVNVPLIHPAKERSGWLWVVWTFLLILVGALGAATLWYFKLLPF